MSPKEKFLLFFSGILYLLIAIFSYAFVDLNLTLSSNKLILTLITALQKIGYYNRPLSTLIFTTLITSAFIFFFINLYLFKKGKISIKYLFYSQIFSTLILIFAYPFLSADIFNYLFDAKIIAKYHLNPYTHKALDFPADDWTRFMRWTHRYSPYGPVWLAASLFPTIIGIGKFTLTLLYFKIFISIFNLLNSFIIYKTLNKIKGGNIGFNLALYALNPLFLIEGVVNAHNDVLLATFILLSVFLLIASKKTLSFLTLLFGFLTKYITILITPWFILNYFKPNLLAHKKVLQLSFATLLIFTVIFSTIKVSVPFINAGATQVQFQPWYLFWSLPLVPLLTTDAAIYLLIGLSISSMLRYLPYLYYGDWSHPHTVIFMQTVTVFFPVLFLLYFLLFKKKLND